MNSEQLTYWLQGFFELSGVTLLAADYATTT